MIAGFITALLLVGFLIMIISFTIVASEREVKFRKAWLREQQDAKILEFKEKQK